MKDKIRFCRSGDGVRIAYSISGKGPILVKAANWISHMEYDRNTPLWKHWYEFLEGRFTLIRYDQRGCGLSDRDIPNFSFEALVEDLHAVTTDARAERFHIVGISQGGPIALAYARRYPQKILSLIIYGSYLQGAMIRAKTQQEVEEANLLVKLVELGWGRDKPDFRQVFSTQFIPDGNLEELQSLNELQRISTSPANAASILECLNHIDISDLAVQITVPALVLHARGDSRVPFEAGRRLAAVLPEAQFVPLESNNHILLGSESAWGQFKAAVLDFLNTNANLLPAADDDPLCKLTMREREIMSLIAKGLSNPEISQMLFISPRTVRNHITNIFAKLNVNTRAKAILIAQKGR